MDALVVSGLRVRRLSSRGLARTRTWGRAYLRWRWAPHATLVLALAAVIVYAARIGLRVDQFALDETVIKQSAVHDTQNLPHSLLHDLNARATSRLYSLVLSVVMRIWSGDTAVRYGKVLNVVLYVSTAVPVWLLAREFLASRWRIAAAALLSVAAPWLTITTVLYTECLTYPVFVWTLVAMAWCVRAPSARRDLVVMAAMVALVCTRVQFASIFVVWVVIIAVVHWSVATGSRGRWWRARNATRSAIAGHPFGLGVVALALLYVLYLAQKGVLHAKLRVDLGTYSELQDRPGVTPDYLPSLMVEVVNFAVGTGVLPVVAALAWWCAALRRRGDPRQWGAAVVAVVAGVGTTLATLYVQGGYLGAFTEERYYMYLVPLLWIGALAALQSPLVRRSWLAVAGGAVVITCATMPLLDPLDHQYVFLGTAGAVVAHLSQRFNDLVPGLTERDGVALIALAVVALGMLAWRATPRPRLAVWIVAPALVQLAVAGYAFAAIDGQVGGVPGNVGSDFASLSFIDRAVPHGTPVTWLDAQRKPADNSAEAVQRIALFWNQDISAVAYDPALGIPLVSYSLDTTTLRPLSVAPSTGIVTSAAPLRYLVVPAGSPFLQIGAVRVLATSPFGLVLVQPGTPVAATWQALGLAPDGTVPATTPARLRAWGEGEVALRMTFVATSATPATMALTLGGHPQQIVVPVGAAGTTVSASGCAALGHPLAGTLKAVAGSAELLAVTPAVGRRC